MKIPELIGKKIAVHCPTEEMYVRCLEILRLSIYTATHAISLWHAYEESLCFEIDADAIDGNIDLGFSCESVGYFSSYGYEIITAEEFIKSNSSKDT